MFLRIRPIRSSIVKAARSEKPSTFFPTASRQFSNQRRSNVNSSFFTPLPDRGQPKRAAIRPITLFAICIPIGYLLSWAVQAQKEADEDGFVRYTLARKEEVSPTCSIFTLRPVDSSAVLSDHGASKRAIMSVQFKQPQLQIARFYTLLPATPEQDPHELRFLIRRERNGEVSGYLHRLPLGSELELRGMCVEYVFPEHVDKVLFLAGGTGIAPAMQAADAVAAEADVHILWASRRREDCAGGKSDTRNAKVTGGTWSSLEGLFGIFRPTNNIAHTGAEQQSLVVSQLESLKQRSTAGSSSKETIRLKVDYFVDDEGSFIKAEKVAQLLQEGESGDGSAGKKILFIAGPDGFINHWASNKIWANGRELQGPIGGVVSRMNLTGWEVVKL